MDVSLGRSSIQMPNECGDLVPRLPLSHEDRDERVTEGVVPVQTFEIRALDELLEESIRLVASPLFD